MLRPSGGAVAPVGAAPFSVSIYDNIGEVAAVWCAFEAVSSGTVFQSHLWCRAWHETIGTAIGASVRIVTIADSSGNTVAILPLQIRRRGGARVLEWLGTPHINYGYGVYHKDVLAAGSQALERQLAAVITQVEGYDAIALTEMPDRLLGATNPMAPLFNVRGANQSFSLRLIPDFETLHASKRGGEDRRTARKKEKALAACKSLSFGLPQSGDELHDVLTTMFRHQASRLAERGVYGIFGPMEQAFIHRLAALQNPERPILRPYTFRADGEILAVMLGGHHSGTYWALISSLAPGALRKYSPGDLALRRTIRACCEAGIEQFDFSAGDSPYKRAWADDVIQLHNMVAARNWRGLLWVMSAVPQMTLKRIVKNSPALKSITLGLRRILFGRNAVSH